MAQEQTMKNLVIGNLHLTTGDYKSDPSGKFKRSIERKTVYISGEDDLMRQLAEFGITIYTPRDPQSKPFAMIPFSRKTAVFYEDVKQREDVEFDSTMPNFEFISAKLSIFKGVSEQGQVFYRISALKVPSADFIRQFSATFFDDDDEYTQVENNAGLSLIGDVSNNVADNLPF